MAKEKIRQLVHILEESDSELPASLLAKRLGVSERSIRNYVNTVNEEKIYTISSSRAGYMLTSRPRTGYASKDGDEIKEREYHILSKLLTESEGVSAFDAAEELMVSESTIINSVIPRIREQVKDFGLEVQSKNYSFFLVGSERNKRRLIGHLATNNSYGFFTSSETITKLFPDFNVSSVLQGLYDITQHSNLLLNNYALNNLLVHLLVILLRLESEDTLPQNESTGDVSKTLNEFENRAEIIDAADRIAEYFRLNFNVIIPSTDYEQILLLIAISVDHDITKLDQIIEKEFVESVGSILQHVSERYGTPAFSREFILQFSLHMYQAGQRYEYSISYPNPLGLEIKKDYAPIYDMAVYFAHRFCRLYSIELSEDEIAFIAFHLGAYLENNKTSAGGLTVAVVVEAYHTFSSKLINDIRNIYSTEIASIEVFTLNRYILIHPKCDLLITTIRNHTEHPYRVLVSPILTKQNIIDIWSMIQEIHSEMIMDNSAVFLKRMLHKDLYFRDIPFDSPEECIRFLGNRCRKLGFVQPEFIQDVLLRESVSSTAFTDYVAIPHSISHFPDQSFVCVLHNSTPLAWSGKNVSFVLMIGIAESDMKYFNDSFGIIIDKFSSKESTNALLKSGSFEEFSEILLSRN